MTARWRTVIALCGALAGGAGALFAAPAISRIAWIGVTLLVGIPLAKEVARSLWRRNPGVDVIALLAMLAAVSFGEHLAAAVVAIMVSGGLSLEEAAGARARKDLSALLARSPRLADRREGDEIVRIEADEVRPGDRLLVRQGEIVPVDGSAAGSAVIDESALTGESVPVERAAGDPLRSGAVNAGAPFDMIATATAARSTYAGMVRLAQAAEANKAPFVRMADRYAGFFLPVTLLAAGTAWALSGDPRRAVAVLVVATPCPMILAAPIALVSGISRGARRGILFKGGSAVEGLARASVLLMDKTGTLTVGAARVAEVVPFGDRDPDEILRLAGSLDQLSSHVFAPAIVREARARGLVLSMPDPVLESPGLGVRGVVDGRPVAVGKGSWVAGGEDPAEALRVQTWSVTSGSSSAFVAIDGGLAGAIVLVDPIREDAVETIHALRRAGIRRVVVVTGDSRSIADRVGATIGADEVIAERSAKEKVDVVRLQKKHGFTVMVGDGVNDAPALAQADVGVALGARGSAASAESADVVLLVDRLDRLADAMLIAKRSIAIARQSVLVGMALSLGAMSLAAMGWLPPVAGAMVQEAIDVAVILNALRALRSSRRHGSVGSSPGLRFQRQNV